MHTVQNRFIVKTLKTPPNWISLSWPRCFQMWFGRSWFHKSYWVYLSALWSTINCNMLSSGFLFLIFRGLNPHCLALHVQMVWDFNLLNWLTKQQNDTRTDKDNQDAEDVFCFSGAIIKLVTTVTKRKCELGIQPHTSWQQNCSSSYCLVTGIKQLSFYEWKGSNISGIPGRLWACLGYQI